MGLVNSLFSFFSYPEENYPEVLDTSEGTGIIEDTKSEESTGDDTALSPVQSSLPGTKENSVHIFQNPLPVKEIKEVDRLNIIVKYRGKKMTIDMFPLEKLSVLKQNACQEAGIRKKNFKLVYEGQFMEENRTIFDYKLRGGKEVSLICVK